MACHRRRHHHYFQPTNSAIDTMFANLKKPSDTTAHFLPPPLNLIAPCNEIIAEMSPFFSASAYFSRATLTLVTYAWWCLLWWSCRNAEQEGSRSQQAKRRKVREKKTTTKLVLSSLLESSQDAKRLVQIAIDDPILSYPPPPMPACLPTSIISALMYGSSAA